MPATRRRQRLAALREEVRELKETALRREERSAAVLARVHESHRAGAANMLHYLALRSRDLRPLQERLTDAGLSSLGRMESNVLGNLHAVLAVLDDAIDGVVGDRIIMPGERLRAELPRGAAALFGGAPEDRSTRIMVTLPTEAAEDAALVAGYAAAGMDVARINSAHDDPDRWRRMARHVRIAGPGIPVAVDLAGPKIRTGPIAPGVEMRQAEARKRRERSKAGKRPALRVHVGDTVTLTADMAPVRPTAGQRHRIGCTLPEALEALEPGHRVVFDDGSIQGVVSAVRPGEADVEIGAAAEGGSKLRAEKGINLPDTPLQAPALSQADRRTLTEAREWADIVQLSFTRSAADVRDLLDALAQAEATALGVIVKIETPSGFQALPEILLEVMTHERAGVMIARGDLGVEVGFTRLAEVQEEMLWLCESARIPVVWATEVLDTLATTGIPTRAEVTDAATANRAECVMLNKGPHIIEAIRALDDILTRMHGHLHKKRFLLRALRSWDRDITIPAVPDRE